MGAPEPLPGAGAFGSTQTPAAQDALSMFRHQPSVVDGIGSLRYDRSLSMNSTRCRESQIERPLLNITERDR